MVVIKVEGFWVIRNSSIVGESLSEILATVLDITELESTIGDRIEINGAHFLLNFWVTYRDIGFRDDSKIKESYLLHDSSEILEVERS